MSKGLAPALLPIVHADDLHRVDGAEKRGCREGKEKDGQPRRRLCHLNRQGRVSSLPVINNFHAAQPFPSAISINSCSRLQNVENAATGSGFSRSKL